MQSNGEIYAQKMNSSEEEIKSHSKSKLWNFMLEFLFM